MPSTSTRVIAASFLLTPTLFSTGASAAGFYLKEQSAEGVGRAFAGDTALARDASIVYFNPAGMTQLEGFTATTNAYALFVQADQFNLGSFRTIPGLPITVPVVGSDGGTPIDQPVPLANFQVAYPVDDRNLWVGLGINSPFGLNVKYFGDWFGRYDSRKSLLFTLNFQPSVAYRLNDSISVGAGVDIQYADVTLTNKLPQLDPLLPDGELRISGDDWSVGWNAGFFVDLDNVHLGAHYRSGVEHKLEGEVGFSGLLGPLAPLNGVVGGTAPVTLPDLVTGGLMIELPQAPVRVLFDVSWFNWSDFDEIRVDTFTGGVIQSPQNYKDTWSFALGLEYDLNERWTVRTGTQYDQTPTREGFRTTRVPDGDRWWAAIGATYDLTERYSVALSYAHVFVTDELVDLTTPFFEGTPAQIDVTTFSQSSGAADIVALGITAKF